MSPATESPLDALARWLRARGAAHAERPAADLERVADALALRSLAAGELLFELGQPSDGLYVLLRGALEVSVPMGAERVSMATLDPDETVGEIQALTGGPRTAWVRAREASELLHVPEAALRALLEAEPWLEGQLGEIGRARLRHQQLVAIFLERFGPEDRSGLAELEEKLEWVRLPRGARLVREGETSDTLYFVISGRLRAIREGDEPHTLGEVGPGETVGEMALLAGEPRRASVYALRDSELAAISRRALESVLGRHPALIFPVTRSLLRRQEGGPEPGPGELGPSNLVILPLDADVPAAQFARRLAAQLGHFGSVAHLDARNLDADVALRRVALSGEEGAQGLRLEAWLAEQESGHRFVLYQADAQPSPWTRRCLRHADHVLLVAHATSGTARREIERTSLETENLRTAPSCTLVLISRDASESPPHMGRWLDLRSPTRHHRVRWDRDDDILRLARFLAGRAIGLVLGGGGARTAAHVGVLRALEEARIPIDAIGGTSGGAVVAALYAMGRDHARILREMRATFVENRPWRSVTLPLVSLVSARRLDAAAQRIYGDTRIEDLWRDFFCVSCDLISGSPVIHRRGEMWRAVRASTSLPGIMPPVPFEGRLLVDGGVMDNLPGTVMREVCGGDVIASDVSAPLRLKVDYPEAPSVPALLASWVLPGRAPIDVPNVLHVMGRVCAIAGIQRREASVKGASLYLRPPVERYRLLEFDAMERIAELAYDYASKAIADSSELGRLASSG